MFYLGMSSSRSDDVEWFTGLFHIMLLVICPIYEWTTFRSTLPGHLNHQSLRYWESTFLLTLYLEVSAAWLLDLDLSYFLPPETLFSLHVVTPLVHTDTLHHSQAASIWFHWLSSHFVWFRSEKRLRQYTLNPIKLHFIRVCTVCWY